MQLEPGGPLRNPLVGFGVAAYPSLLSTCVDTGVEPRAGIEPAPAAYQAAARSFELSGQGERSVISVAFVRSRPADLNGLDIQFLPGTASGGDEVDRTPICRLQAGGSPIELRPRVSQCAIHRRMRGATEATFASPLLRCVP